jgi:polyisoprenoid-binding protein YceI
MHEFAIVRSKHRSHVRRGLQCGTWLLLALLFCACAGQPGRPAADGKALHQHAHARVFRIDPERSSIRLRVYRDGPLARFGHNHVVAVAGLTGRVLLEKELAQSAFELTIPVAQMVVDRPADRAAAGPDFAGELSEFAVAGTRENMLGPKLLAADQYPDISLVSVGMEGVAPNVRFLVEVTVRGVKSQVAIPATIETGDRVIVVKGQSQLLQSQLGLTPFSVLGGGLRVRDAIDADYHLVAVRAE